MKAILICFFGTTYEDAYKKSILPIIERTKAQYGTEYEIEFCYTSRMIAKVLKNRGIEIKNEIEAMDALLKKGCDDIIAFCTHIIPGFEYEKITELKKKYPNLKVSSPLIMPETVSEFAESVDFGEDEILFMGHGTDHRMDILYDSLADCYKKIGKSNIHMATVEGKRNLDFIMPELKTVRNKKLILRPFMLVAGDHAKNDMAGDEDDSWKNILTNAGFSVETQVQGLGEENTIRDLFFKRLEEELQ